MQEEGKVQFLVQQRSNTPTCCAFQPKDRYVFAWGGSEGGIEVHSALRGNHLRSIILSTMSLSKGVNALTFTPDGAKIIASSCIRRVSVIDAERGDVMLAYENCASPGQGAEGGAGGQRQPLAAHPELPYLVACTTVNSRGITLLDLRMPLPLDFVYDIHDDIITDLHFLDSSWPWGCGKSVLVSSALDGHCKVSGLDGSGICVFSTKAPVTCLLPSPEKYNATSSMDFPSMLVASTGEGIVSWCVGNQPWKWDAKIVTSAQATRLRYTKNGAFVYAGMKGGSVQRCRRFSSKHENVDCVFTHTGPVIDLDISPYDEYLVSVSQDHSLGLVRLGSPNHGWTQCCEFT